MMDGSQRVAADRSSADEAYTNYVKQISDAWQTPTDEPTLRKDRGEGVADAGASTNPYETYIDTLRNSWKS